MQRHVRKLLVVVVVLAAVATALASSASASVFVNGKRWPISAPEPGHVRGYAYIPICIVDGSSVAQLPDGDPLGEITEPAPSLDTVISTIRSTLSSTWEADGAVRFTGWRPCDDLTETERAKTVGFYLNPNASNESKLGTDARGHTTATEPGVQMKPWGPDYNSDQCIRYVPWPGNYRYDLACAREYAVHEFGHTLGFVHEWENPAKPATCDDEGEGQVAMSDLSTTYDPSVPYTVVNPTDYDWDSVMNYGTDCAHVTGERFGSPTPSPTDIQGIQAVYPPEQDVGVLEAGSCGSAQQIELGFDDENTNDTSRLSGWTGSSTQADGRTILRFCRADGGLFRRTSQPYEVLRLGQACPSASYDLLQLVDTEDDATNDTVSDAAAALPNAVTPFPKGMSRYPEMLLHWCVFQAASSTTAMPNLGYAYGVFAASGFPGAGESGTIFMDDENDSNEDGFSGLPVPSVISSGPDTTMHVVAASAVPPTLSPIDSQTVPAGRQLSVPFTVSDSDTPISNVTLSVSSHDQSVVANTGISVTGSGSDRKLIITPAQAGLTSISVRAGDGHSSTTATFALDVTAPPVVTSPATLELSEDSAYDFQFDVHDPDGNAWDLTFGVASSDPTLIAPADVTVYWNGVIAIRPRPNANGTATLTFAATDITGLTTRWNIVVTVDPVPDAPTVQLDGLVPTNEGGTLLLGASTYDADGDPLTYTWSATSGTITGSGPRVNYQAGDGPGRATVTVTVTDPSGLSATASGTVDIANVPPQVTVNLPAAIYWGVPASLSAAITDASADQAAGIGVVWKFGDGSTTPAQGASVSHVFHAVGTYRVGVTATDKDGGESVAFVNVTVNPRPTALRPSSVRPTGIVVGLDDAYDSTQSMAGATVLFRLNGVTYPATVGANNTATFAPPRLAPGQYPVQILFGGNSLYGPTGAAVNLVVS